ncbi:unnamed protein product, partial [marine sediment metagenome]
IHIPNRVKNGFKILSEIFLAKASTIKNNNVDILAIMNILTILTGIHWSSVIQR